MDKNTLVEINSATVDLSRLFHREIIARVPLLELKAAAERHPDLDRIQDYVANWTCVGEELSFQGWSLIGAARPQPKNDPVNHPAHYTAYDGLEIIDLTEQMMSNRGNAVKYIARAGLKNPDTEIEDLQKAKWYIEREVQRMTRLAEKKKSTPPAEKDLGPAKYLECTEHKIRLIRNAIDPAWFICPRPRCRVTIRHPEKLMGDV